MDNGDSKVLALLDAQPPWKGSRPHQGEDLRLPHSSEEDEEPKKGTKLKQLPENLKDVLLDSEEKYHVIINSSLKNVKEEKLIQATKEVVRKELVKLLDASPIYPIFDSIGL